MATPNYGYEKRQKELAKKRKKEDKLRDKANRKTGVGGEGESSTEGGSDGGGGAPNPPAPAQP